MHFDKARMELIGSVDISGANSGVLEVGAPTHVKRIVAVVTTAVTVAAATITVSKRNASGSGGSTTYGTFDIPVAAVNAVYFANVLKPSTTASTGSDGSTVYTTPTQIRVDPGQELVVTSDGGATAGVVTFWADMIPDGFDENDGTEATVTLS